MRLLKTNCVTVFEFEQFYDQTLPAYAILSHTWSKNPGNEVLYTDVVNGTSSDKPAYRKVQAALLQAKEDGYDYCWVDTCCIDKSSSAELSEAINSMYRWYQGARICYVLLEDVSTQAVSDASLSGSLLTELQKSRWFGRGWTLQELLAPSHVRFYLKEWVDIPWNSGARLNRHLISEPSLWSTISIVTGIDEDILQGTREVQSASVAERMSWAAHRKTSRLEDEAYCLMGIFNVNMPMLYGEGSKSFIRLQEEIIKRSEDESIFAWKRTNRSSQYHGLLADSPKAFVDSGGFLQYDADDHFSGVEQNREQSSSASTWMMTNRGLSLSLPLLGAGEQKTAVLRCHDPQNVGFIGIRLQRVKGNQYARIDCQHLEIVLRAGTPEQIFVPQVFFSKNRPQLPVRVALQMRKISATETGRWNTARESDYVVNDAIFFGNESSPWQAGAASPWMEVPEQITSASLIAAFLIQNVHYSHRFLLLIYLVQQHGRPERLRFCAVEKPRSFRLGRSLSACVRDVLVRGCEADKSWQAVDGKSVRGVSLSATSHDVPGGRCFNIDVAVHANMA